MPDMTDYSTGERPYNLTLGHMYMKLVSLTFDEGVTHIGDFAFKECRGLTAFNIPDSLQSIGQSAFNYCSALNQSLVFPEGFSSVGPSCFYLCKKVSSLSIPSTLPVIPKDCFKNCSGLSSLTIPNTVRELGQDCFSFCGALDSVTMPIELFGKDRDEKGFDAFALASTSSTDEQTYASSIHFTVADTGIMPDMTDYSTGERPYNLTLGHMYMKLVSLTFDEGITHIGSCAFMYCSALNDLTLPSTLESIGKSAFSGCNALSPIDYPGAKVIWDQTVMVASNNQPLLDALHFALESGWCGPEAYYIYEDALLHVYGNGSIDVNAFAGKSDYTAVKLDDGITAIGSGAFQNCTALAKATLPASLQDVGENAFNGSDNLLLVFYDETREKWDELTSHIAPGNDPLLFARALTRDLEMQAPGFMPPAALREIQDRAFAGIPVRVVQIPDGVRSIGSCAFAQCRDLEEIGIPTSVTSIAEDAFLDVPMVIVFGEAGSEAQTYADAHENCWFVPLQSE